MNFRWRFVIRAGESEIDAFGNVQRQLFSCFGNKAPKFQIVSASHVRKTWAKAIIVQTDEWVRPLQIDVVAKDDECALGIIEINSAGGVGDDDGLYAHTLE